MWPNVWSGDLQVEKKYGHPWHRMSLLRPGVIKQHKPTNLLYLNPCTSNIIYISQQFQVPRNKMAHHWTLTNLELWVEPFLIAHTNVRVRNATAFLLVALVPSNHFRQVRHAKS